MKRDPRTRDQRMLDFIELVAIGDAGPLGAQVLLQQLKEEEGDATELWKRLNRLSHHFGYDTPNARLCGDAAQCIKGMLAALQAARLVITNARPSPKGGAAALSQINAAIAKAKGTP